MRALGEDPAHFQRLLEGLWEEWNPAGALQEGVVIRLARALWLVSRADRMQEGYALRQAQEVSSGRHHRLHAQMMRLKITADHLRLLVQSVAHRHYVTPPDDLEKMKKLHQEGVLKDLGEITLALFYELQAPGTGEDGMDVHEQSRRALIRIQEIFGLNGDQPPQLKVATPHSCPPPAGPQDAQAGGAPAGGSVPADPSLRAGQAPKAAPTPKPDPYPNITEAEWIARERPRQLLENILTRQVEICEEQHKALLKESVKGPSPYERAAEIAPTHPNVQLMRRMQDSNFREVRRLTNLLLRLKRYERQSETSKETAPFQDVAEKKGVSCIAS
jgi:hypothetical protein